MRYAIEGAVDGSAYQAIDFSRTAWPVRSGDLDHRPRITGQPSLYPALDGLLGERRKRGQHRGSEQHRKARGTQHQAVVRGSTHRGRRTSPAQLAGLPRTTRHSMGPCVRDPQSSGSARRNRRPCPAGRDLCPTGPEPTPYIKPELLLVPKLSRWLWRGHRDGHYDRGVTIKYEWRGDFGNAALNALHADGFGHPVVQTDWRERLERHSLGWVCAWEDGSLIGFVNVVWDGGVHAFILDTVVARHRRASGIGAALVATAAHEARAAKCEWLHVDFEERLSSFYFDACGFRETTAGLIAL